MINAKRQKLYATIGVLIALVGFGWIAIEHWQIVLWKRTLPLTDIVTTHCPVHGDKLLIEKVPVRGLVTVSYEAGYQEAVWEAQPRLFPWTGQWHGAGGYGTNDPKVGWMMRKRCVSCSEADEIWHENYQAAKKPNKP
jgi:hypothetical protein